MLQVSSLMPALSRRGRISAASTSVRIPSLMARANSICTTCPNPPSSACSPFSVPSPRCGDAAGETERRQNHRQRTRYAPPRCASRIAIEMPADDRVIFVPRNETSRPAQLLLHVTFGKAQNTYLVQPGITIGRSPDNAVCVDHCDLTAFHARVHRVDGQMVVTTTDSHWWLTLPSGNDTRSIELADGAEFSIGEVSFRCTVGHVVIVPHDEDPKPVKSLAEDSESQQDDEPGLDDDTIDELLSSMRFNCPRCSEMLLLLPGSAEFCPRCGVKLPQACPPWVAESGESD